LDVNGARIRTDAAKGATGLWLLDPADIYIGAPQDPQLSYGVVIDPVFLQNALLTNNVELSTLAVASAAPPVVTVGTSIPESLLSASSPTGSYSLLCGDTTTNSNCALLVSGVGTGSIFVNAPVSWAGSSASTKLTLRSAADITLAADLGSSSGADLELITASGGFIYAESPLLSAQTTVGPGAIFKLQPPSGGTGLTLASGLVVEGGASLDLNGNTLTLGSSLSPATLTLSGVGPSGTLGALTNTNTSATGVVTTAGNSTSSIKLKAPIGSVDLQEGARIGGVSGNGDIKITVPFVADAANGDNRLEKAGT
jgi:hypothetical protein